MGGERNPFKTSLSLETPALNGTTKRKDRLGIDLVRMEADFRPPLSPRRLVRRARTSTLSGSLAQQAEKEEKDVWGKERRGEEI